MWVTVVMGMYQLGNISKNYDQQKNQRGARYLCRNYHPGCSGQPHLTLMAVLAEWSPFSTPQTFLYPDQDFPDQGASSSKDPNNALLRKPRCSC